MTDSDKLNWRKSTRSNGGGGNCVEVADRLVDVVAVRDSKDITGPVLTFGPEQWRTFVAAVKVGRFDW